MNRQDGWVGERCRHGSLGRYCLVLTIFLKEEQIWVLETERQFGKVGDMGPGEVEVFKGPLWTTWISTWEPQGHTEATSWWHFSESLVLIWQVSFQRGEALWFQRATHEDRGWRKGFPHRDPWSSESWGVLTGFREELNSTQDGLILWCSLS